MNCNDYRSKKHNNYNDSPSVNGILLKAFDNWIAMRFLFLIAVLIGCNNEAPVISIGVSVPQTTAPVYTLMKQAMLEHEKEYGVKITWNGVRDKGPTQDDVLTERQGVQRMLESKIRALIIKPVDPKAAYPILREARRWNVPVISLDQMLPSMPVHGHVTVDETRLGAEAAQYALEQIGHIGNVLVLEAPVKIESMREIAIGIHRVLDQYEGKIQVISRTSALEANAAFDVTGRMLKDYAGNIQAVIAVDSTLALGAVQGVQLHGLADKIVTVGVGAREKACRQIILKQHDAEVDLMPYERGLETLKAAVSALNGDSFSYDAQLPNGEILTKTRFGPIRLITTANHLLLERMWPSLFASN